MILILILWKKTIKNISDEDQLNITLMNAEPHLKINTKLKPLSKCNNKNINLSLLIKNHLQHYIDTRRLIFFILLGKWYINKNKSKQIPKHFFEYLTILKDKVNMMMYIPKVEGREVEPWLESLHKYYKKLV